MPVQTKKKRAKFPVRFNSHPTVTGEPGRQAPSLFAAWDYMAEEDKMAIEEIVNKYSKLARA
jgi:hypothetical protein